MTFESTNPMKMSYANCFASNSVIFVPFVVKMAFNLPPLLRLPISIREATIVSKSLSAWVHDRLDIFCAVPYLLHHNQDSPYEGTMNFLNFDSDETFDMWMSLFLTLSTEFFGVYSSALNFPSRDIDLSDEFKQIAKEFGLIAMAHHPYESKKTPNHSIKYLINSISDSDAVATAWKKTFVLIEPLGYANFVYQWGKEIYDRKTKLQNYLFTHKTDYVLISWVENPVDSKYLSLNLSDATIHKLLYIITFYLYKYFKILYWEEKMHRKQENEWDEFVGQQIGLISWLGSRLIEHYELLKWKNIIQSLSNEELTIFDIWIKENSLKLYGKVDSFSVVELAKILYEQDL